MKNSFEFRRAQSDEVQSTCTQHDLQEVIALVKGAKLDFAVQFTNYR